MWHQDLVEMLVDRQSNRTSPSYIEFTDAELVKALGLSCKAH